MRTLNNLQKSMTYMYLVRVTLNSDYFLNIVFLIKIRRGDGFRLFRQEGIVHAVLFVYILKVTNIC